jgi:NADH dehydrogenase
MFGNGNYKLQPIFVEDFADLAVEQGFKSSNAVIDATGPDIFTYKELIKAMSAIMLEKERKVFPLPDEIGLWISKIVGLIKGDKLITRQEIKGLKADLLYSDGPPAGKTKLTDWLKQNKDTIGKNYANELKRRLDRTVAYK